MSTNPPSGYTVTAKAGEIPYAAFTEKGWTLELMEQHGYVEKVEPPPAEQNMVRVGIHPNEAAINAVRATIYAIEISSAEEELPAVEAELQQAREKFANTELTGDQDTIHLAHKWVQRVEREHQRLCKILKDQPRPKLTQPGDYIGASLQAEIFKGFTYVNDIHRIIGPSGFVYDKAKFDAHQRFAGRQYQMMIAGTKPTTSAWDAFVLSELQAGEKVEQCYFDPRDPPGHIKMKEGNRIVNTWRPVPIRMVDGDVSPFIEHLKTLYPDGWRLLLNYLKFMVQKKGTKCMWWPFLQGVPGNGKSFISDTLEYCIGYKFTQRPTPKNIDGQFNASLYGCLFLALEDIKETDDFGAMWDTLKPMVTQARLEIQPKGVDKVTREVCFNGIMNSNHKTGIKKDADDRRIAPFFSRQQRKSDLERDGLTDEYFEGLWAWALADGWAHVAYYLATDPIDADFSSTKCPVTTSTAEHVRLSRPTAQQILLAAVRAVKQGFKGGWVNMLKFHEELTRDPKTRYTSANKQQQHAEDLGYVPHPGLPEGQLTVPLPDGSHPVLYVTSDHTTRVFTDAAQIAAAYLEAQK
jgi:Family of unknown function (DUF5906)